MTGSEVVCRTKTDNRNFTSLLYYCKHLKLQMLCFQHKFPMFTRKFGTLQSIHVNHLTVVCTNVYGHTSLLVPQSDGFASLGVGLVKYTHTYIHSLVYWIMPENQSERCIHKHFIQAALVSFECQAYI